MKTAIRIMSVALAVILVTQLDAQACDPLKLCKAPVAISPCNCGICYQPRAVLCYLNDEDHADRGWFGVRLDIAGEAISQQLGLEGNGLVVTNVGGDSPAAQSGLQQYDIIVSFDGEDVGHDANKLAKSILDLGEGAEVDYVVYRDAKELKLHATLGKRPKGVNWNWKYADSPITLFEESHDLKGRMMWVLPNGTVKIEELSNVGSRLPKEFVNLIPRLRRQSFQVYIEDGLTKQKCVVEKDGTKIEIKTGEDDEIVVRRTTEEGDEEVVEEKTYDSAEALEDADAEAFEIYEDVKLRRLGRIFVAPMPQNVAPFPVPGPDPHLHEKWKEAYEHMAEAMRKAKELDNNEIREQVEKAMSRAKERLAEAAERYQYFTGKAKYSFQKEADGSIRVTIRKGDSELTKVFKDEDALQLKSPSLFERYEQLESSE